LTGVTFKGAFMQGAEFKNATMDGADFSDTDWYNAFSFDVRPLTQTQRRALNECPIGIEYFIKEFDGDYAISFERSSLRFQQQTTSRWNEVSPTWKRLRSS